jgi:hypothetical protein
MHLFILYLATLSVADTLKRRMIGWFMINELERVWKETDVA